MNNKDPRHRVAGVFLSFFLLRAGLSVVGKARCSV